MPKITRVAKITFERGELENLLDRLIAGDTFSVDVLLDEEKRHIPYYRPNLADDPLRMP